MKKSFIIPLALVGLLTASCNFLNVDDYFEDTFSEERIFESQYNIERYFNGAVNQLPKEGRIYYWCSVPGATGSDEAVSCGTFYNGILDVSFPGTELTTDKITYTETGGWDWNFNVWPNCYKVIRKVNTILPHIDEVPDMNAFDKMEFRARARFLRAYAYYWILQNQGPMILVGDQVLNTNETPDYYQAERSTYDECVDYICSELEAAAESLETEQPLDLFGSPTKGAALALVARLRLQAASPLFNGGAAARRYFGAFKRKSDGVHYISQTYDESKWAVAAAAAKRVIDLGIYRLHTVPADEYTLPLPSNVPSDPFPAGAGGIDPFRSYSEMFTGETTNVTNPELIWGTTQNITDQQDVVFPLKLGGNSSISIPQRIVDAYRMADGRDINNASAEYPYEDRPYDQTCVTAADKQLSKNYTLPGGTYKAYDNREPRFYASIGFSGTLWQMQSTTSEEMRNKIVEYYNGANAGKNQAGVTNIYNLTGYTCYKYVHPRCAYGQQRPHGSEDLPADPLRRNPALLRRGAEQPDEDPRGQRPKLLARPDRHGRGFQPGALPRRAPGRRRRRTGGRHQFQRADPARTHGRVPPRKPPLLRHLPLGHFRGTGTRAADGPERRSRKMGGILRPDGHLVPYDPRTDIQVQVHVHAAAPQRTAQSTEPGSEPGLGEIVNSKKFRR